MLRDDFATVIFERLAIPLIVVEQAGTVLPGNEEAALWARSDLERLFHEALDAVKPRCGSMPLAARLRALAEINPEAEVDVAFRDRIVHVRMMAFREPIRLGGRPPVAAAALIFDPARLSQARAETASRFYGLTSAETTVARLVLEGLSPIQIATHLRVAQATVRTHLARLFAKTETRRQTELLRLLLLVPPARSARVPNTPSE
jgi:DNA-binding CsgD family transcriptional regulator